MSIFRAQNYNATIGYLENSEYSLRLFCFIDSPPVGFGDYRSVHITSVKMDSEIDPIEFKIKDEQVKCSFLQILEGSRDVWLWDALRTGLLNSTHSAVFLPTDHNFYFEIYYKRTDNYCYYRHRRGSESMSVDNDGSVQIEMTFTAELSGVDQIKQWNLAGTSRTSVWSSIFSGNKPIIDFIADMVGPVVSELKLVDAFGSPYFDKQSFIGDSYYPAAGTPEYSVGNLYLKSTDYSEGTSVDNSKFKTIADVLKDISQALSWVFYSNGLSTIRVIKFPNEENGSYKLTVSLEDFEQGKMKEECIFSSLKGFLFSQTDGTNYNHSTSGTVYLKNNELFDEKNGKQRKTKTYIKKTGFSPDCTLWLTASLFKCEKINSETSQSEYMKATAPTENPYGNPFRVVKVTGLRIPTFKKGTPFSFYSSHSINGKSAWVTRIERDFLTLMDEITYLYAWVNPND